MTAGPRPRHLCSIAMAREGEAAALVLVCAISLFNVRLLLRSGSASPRAGAGDGVVGRN